MQQKERKTEVFFFRNLKISLRKSLFRVITIDYSELQLNPLKHIMYTEVQFTLLLMVTILNKQRISSLFAYFRAIALCQRHLSVHVLMIVFFIIAKKNPNYVNFTRIVTSNFQFSKVSRQNLSQLTCTMAIVSKFALTFHAIKLFNVFRTHNYQAFLSAKNQNIFEKTREKKEKNKDYELTFSFTRLTLFSSIMTLRIFIYLSFKLSESYFRSAKTFSKNFVQNFVSLKTHLSSITFFESLG